jgi:hypothetical protein
LFNTGGLIFVILFGSLWVAQIQRRRKMTEKQIQRTGLEAVAIKLMGKLNQCGLQIKEGANPTYFITEILGRFLLGRLRVLLKGRTECFAEGTGKNSDFQSATENGAKEVQAFEVDAEFLDRITICVAARLIRLCEIDFFGREHLVGLRICIIDIIIENYHILNSTHLTSFITSLGNPQEVVC